MEPVFLRDDLTGELVRDTYGNPMVIGEAPVRPQLSYLGTPPMSYAAPPSMAAYPAYSNPALVGHTAARPGYGYGDGYSPGYGSYGCCGGASCCPAGCCVGGLGGLGCCLCCDECCFSCDFCCDDFCFNCC